MRLTDELRLLPWAGPEGKPCYLSSDGAGFMSRLADQTEAVQLGLAGELIEEAQQVLADRSWTPGELHLLTVWTTARWQGRKPGPRRAADPEPAPDRRRGPPHRAAAHDPRIVVRNSPVQDSSSRPTTGFPPIRPAVGRGTRIWWAGALMTVRG